METNGDLVNSRIILLSHPETIKVLKLSLTEFSLPKFYQLFGISKVKSAAVSAFRSSYRPGDRSFAYTPPEQERMSLQNLEVITDALLEIMEVGLFIYSFAKYFHSCLPCAFVILGRMQQFLKNILSTQFLKIFFLIKCFPGKE